MSDALYPFAPPNPEEDLPPSHLPPAEDFSARYSGPATKWLLQRTVTLWDDRVTVVSATGDGAREVVEVPLAGLRRNPDRVQRRRPHGATASCLILVGFFSLVCAVYQPFGWMPPGKSLALGMVAFGALATCFWAAPLGQPFAEGVEFVGLDGRPAFDLMESTVGDPAFTEFVELLQNRIDAAAAAARRDLLNRDGAER